MSIKKSWKKTITKNFYFRYKFESFTFFLFCTKPNLGRAWEFFIIQPNQGKSYQNFGLTLRAPKMSFGICEKYMPINTRV